MSARAGDRAETTDRIKTEARDAEILTRQLAAGGLVFVRVPTIEEESLCPAETASTKEKIQPCALDVMKGRGPVVAREAAPRG